jgi:hypothetical protein
MFSRRTLAVGDSIKLMVVLHQKEHHVTGRVLRQERLEPGESTVWRTKVAIAVDVDDAAVMQQLLAVLSP